MDSPACGRAGSRLWSATGAPFTPAPFESTLSSGNDKTPSQRTRSCHWWGRVDSNHRRHSQQIYSLSPLATREHPRVVAASSGSSRFRPWPKARSLRCGSFSNRSIRFDLITDSVVTNRLYIPRFRGATRRSGRGERRRCDEANKFSRLRGNQYAQSAPTMELVDGLEPPTC